MTDAFKAWWATWWAAETQGGERMRSPEKMAKDAWTAGAADMKQRVTDAADDKLEGTLLVDAGGNRAVTFEEWKADWWRRRGSAPFDSDIWEAGRASMKAEAVEAILEASQTTADALGAVEAIEL